MSATESRTHFGDVLRMVEERGEHIAVEKDGVRAAFIVSIEFMERLDQRQKLADWVDSMGEARKIVAQALIGRKPPTARELIDGGRDDVDAE